MKNDLDHSPQLSVIVPVCNVEQFLPECLSSIQDQNVNDIEVICINDGSTDASLEILEQYASEDSRFEIIDKPNEGYGAAMNDGLDKASGKYIAILESDDFCTKNGWSELIALCEKNELDVAKGCYWRHSGKDEFFKVYESTDSHCPPWIAPIPVNEVFQALNALQVFWMTPSIWSCIYKRSFIEQNRIRFNETPGASFQDAGFFFQTWLFSKRSMIVDTPVLHYRIDNAGSSSKSTKKVHTVREEMNFIEGILKKVKSDKIFFQVLCSIRYKTYLWNLKRIADQYIPEFEEGMGKDFLKDYLQGIFSPLLFSKKDAEDFISYIKPHIDTKDKDFSLQYETSPLVSLIVKPAIDSSVLDKCLDSLQKQAYEKIEIICMLDAGDQESVDVICQYCDSDERFNKFVFGKIDESAFEDAFLLSHGDYLAYVDADFIFTRFAVKRLVGTAYTNNADAAFFRLPNEADTDTSKSFPAGVTFIDSYAKEVFGFFSANKAYGMLLKRELANFEDAPKASDSRSSLNDSLAPGSISEENINRVILAKSKNPLIKEQSSKKGAPDRNHDSKPKNKTSGFFQRIARFVQNQDK